MSLKYQSDDDADAVQETGGAQSQPKSPIPLYTTILIVSILTVFVAQLAGGLEWSVDVAGFVKPIFLKNHEYWRILTGATTHGGYLHVGMNCYAFYSFGRIFEMLSNRAHLAIVFLLSAIGGNVLSLIVVPDGISVGASGGIVGLLGYLAIYAFRRRQFISAEFRRGLLFNIGFMVVLGVVLYQIVDNFGHLGGLLTGALYGFVQIPSDVHTDPRNANSVTQITGLAALGIYIATCGFSVLLILNVI